MVGEKYNVSVFNGVALGVDVFCPNDIPARRFLLKKEGSSNPISVCFSILLDDKSNLTV